MHKKNLLIISFLILSCFIPKASNATCSTRTLKQVCDICEEKAQSKLHTDASCPVCEKVNCPTASLSCIKPDSFEALLRSKYTLTTKVLGDAEDLVFKIDTTQSQDSPNTFSFVYPRSIHHKIWGVVLYRTGNYRS